MTTAEIFHLILYVIYATTIAGTIFIVISENRNPIRSLAWIVVLLFLPVFGLACYYFFGQDTRKMKHISEKYYRRVKGLSLDKMITDDKLEKNLPEYRPLVNLLSRSNNSCLMYGSNVEIITTGERKFQALLADMEQAKHHIHMEYFIFYNDETGVKVKEMLMKKAKDGIEVRFLYDNVANWFIPTRFYNEMREAGVQVASFMEVKLAAFHSKVNYRNHRKVVVIDGNIGYMGGMNVANDYAIDPHWRDTHMRILGKGVHGLQASFLIDWYSSGHSLIDNKAYFPDCEPYTRNLMQIATGGPVSPWRNLLQATINIIMNAKKYVYIQTPYFLPMESLFQVLEAAAMGGVDVRLMVSKKSDSAYVDPAARSYYGDLLKVGLRIYELENQFLHAKTMVVDDFVSVVGSANLDFRSFESNFEINCYMYDPEVAARNKEVFFEDLKNCREIKFEEWEKRPVWQKFLESVMRLFAPLM